MRAYGPFLIDLRYKYALMNWISFQVTRALPDMFKFNPVLLVMCCKQQHMQGQTGQLSTCRQASLLNNTRLLFSSHLRRESCLCISYCYPEFRAYVPCVCVCILRSELYLYEI